jgi:hypothetical protein
MYEQIIIDKIVFKSEGIDELGNPYEISVKETTHLEQFNAAFDKSLTPDDFHLELRDSSGGIEAYFHYTSPSFVDQWYLKDLDHISPIGPYWTKWWRNGWYVVSSYQFNEGPSVEEAYPNLRFIATFHMKNKI